MDLLQRSAWQPSSYPRHLGGLEDAHQQHCCIARIGYTTQFYLRELRHSPPSLAFTREARKRIETLEMLRSNWQDSRAPFLTSAKHNYYYCIEVGLHPPFPLAGEAIGEEGGRGTGDALEALKGG
jgi:hypothetical protein